MTLATHTFKTNITCGGCVSNVTPHLQSIAGIRKWAVDTAHPDKFLTVEGDHVQTSQVIEAVKKAGYLIERID